MDVDLASILGAMSGTAGSAQGSLGDHLRRIRLAAGFTTVRALAEKIGRVHTTVSRWETGKRTPSPADIATVCDACGVDDDVRQSLINLALPVAASQWLAVRSADRELQMRALLDFEAHARDIIEVSPLAIPGRMQTREYASAIMVDGGVQADQIETRIAVRMGRASRLAEDSPDNPAVTALIGEPALMQNIGGPAVMARQLRRLLELGDRPHIHVHILPTNSGWTPAHDGPFVIVENTKGTVIVHLENRRAGLFFTEDADIAAYRDAAESVRVAALSVAESADRIRHQITRLENPQ